jgi:hypothetical protein
MAVVRLKPPASQAWLAECEQRLSAATTSGDLDAVVEAAGARALARHGLRVRPAVGQSSSPPRPGRRISRGVRVGMNHRSAATG